MSEPAPSGSAATALAQAGSLLTTAARTLAAAGVLAGVLLAGQHALAASSPSSTSSAQTAPAHAETIHTTSNHPWLTVDRGWVAAGDLHAGEGIVTLDGAAATVAWVHTVPGQADMYNLTVAQDHTFAVGASRAVAHNDNVCTPWQVHIDEGGQPIGVDTSQFEHGTHTLNGGLRNPAAFWKAYQEPYPELINPANAEKIAGDHAPVVDEQWVQFYPEHKPYLGQTLVHHHLEYGPFAIALPEEVHTSQPGWGFSHADRQGPNREMQWRQWFNDRGI